MMFLKSFKVLSLSVSSLYPSDQTRLVNPGLRFMSLLTHNYMVATFVTLVADFKDFLLVLNVRSSMLNTLTDERPTKH